MLPVVVYGCKNLYLTLQEEHRLRASENRVLKRIFGPNREELAGSLRKLHNEELHNLHASPNIIRVIKSRGDEMRGARSTHRRVEKCIQYF
jgi:hypothetical protein